jgi:SAM-dependent methyltransferase
MQPEINPELEPVAAYDRLASGLLQIRQARRAYCDAIDRMVVENIPANARSLLDIGCGEGGRAETIAAEARLKDVVLLEPSTVMRSLITSRREVWPVRIEEIAEFGRKFEVVTCLWNVLGHIALRQRLAALRNMRELLSPDGILLLDVQNRYNAKAYGIGRTLGRIVRDRLLPSPHNGDVTVCWDTGAGPIRTSGHVFTEREMLNLFGEAKLMPRNMRYVDYDNGEVTNSRFRGSMFFALKRTS